MARFNVMMLMLLLIVGIPYYWFVIDNTAPPAEPEAITIEQLRQLAVSPGEPGPQRIRFERVASQWVMGNRLAAGMGLRSIRLHAISYMIDYGDQPPVLIGAGMTRRDSNRFEHQTYAIRAQTRINRALMRARTVVPLAPIPEQTGGLRLIEGTEQAVKLDSNLAQQQQRDRARAPYQVAPGVVVIPTSRFMPGTRMVYVRLMNGREYLFAGKIAPIWRNWYSQRLPARFVTDLGRREDRQAIRAWLLTIQALKRQAPKLVVVPGNAITKGGGLQRFFDESAQILS